MKVIRPNYDRAQTFRLLGYCNDFSPAKRAGDEIVVAVPRDPKLTLALAAFKFDAPPDEMDVLRWRCGVIRLNAFRTEVVVIADHMDPNPKFLPGWRPLESV